MSPQERATRAEALLRDDLVAEAREHMRDSLTRALWKRHALPDADRARLDAMVSHYETFFGFFERVIKEGELAQYDEQQKTRAQEAMDALRRKLRI